MVEVLLAMGLPTLIFGVFALLAMWLGAETRPWFDERPNWWPISRSVPRDDEEEADEQDRDEGPPDGTPAPVPAPARAQPAPVAATRAATSPSGV